MFDNIFSVESIVSLAITITVSFAVTFKIIKLNLTIKNKSHTIKGDGNSIEHNEFNIVMKETQGEFRNLSLLLGGIIILLLPYCGSFVNYFLYNFSRIAPYFLCCWHRFLPYGLEAFLIGFLIVSILCRRYLMFISHHVQLKIHIIL
ncbi:hypothetical protein QJS62_08370 [Klebsiella pneumoniae]|nr:hypothetical protein QJS62_08370 [Klebsiella pneumoniae]